MPPAGHGVWGVRSEAVERVATVSAADASTRLPVSRAMKLTRALASRFDSD